LIINNQIDQGNAFLILLLTYNLPNKSKNMIIKSNNKQYNSEYILYKTETLIKTKSNIYYTTLEIIYKAKQYANETSIENLYLKPILRAILEMNQ
jgi:hypothetical protein